MLGVVAVSCTANATQYRADMAGTSNFADSTIKLADVGHLSAGWRYKWQDANCWPAGQARPWGTFSTPVVWGKTVFQAYDTGCLVALDTDTMARRWMRDFGFQPPLTCTANPGQGIMSTPTIVEEGTGSNKHPYLYLHAPDGYLYKLRADTGADVWAHPAAADPPVDPTVNDYYAWASPLPITDRGLIVVGLSSNCDLPFQRGGVKAFDMATGALVWTWWSEPANPANPRQWDVGGGVWTGLSSDGANVYVSTGSATDCDSSASYQAMNNPDPVPGKFDGVWHQCDPPGDQYSIVKVDASNGQERGVYHAPDAVTGDPDFGSGTTLFPATLSDGRRHQLVGACNKDGYYYALDTQQDASGHLPLVWRVQIGTARTDGERACLTGAVYDRKRDRLFIGGNVVNGDVVTGRVRQVNPATGATIWQTALPSNPLGTGSINDNGVLAYAGMDWENHTTNGIFLIDSSNGALIDTNPSVAGYQQLKDPGSSTSSCVGCSYDQFAQPVWADGKLWMSNRLALLPWSGE